MATFPDEMIARLTGLEQLETIVEGSHPGPTMATSLCFHLVAAEFGKATFEGQPNQNFMNPLGTVHGGWAATILDSALGCAVHSTLLKGERYATLELKVHLTRAILPDMPTLRAIGTIVHRGRQVATSDAQLLGEDDKVYAHGTTTCLIAPGP
ncbi:MAG: PaaI family thioesterase [Devosia sp.]